MWHEHQCLSAANIEALAAGISLFPESIRFQLSEGIFYFSPYSCKNSLITLPAQSQGYVGEQGCPGTLQAVLGHFSPVSPNEGAGDQAVSITVPGTSLQ